jgi:hypothetical protein
MIGSDRTEEKLSRHRKGEVYDLDEIFDNMNFWFFGGKLAKPVLTWSVKKTYRILAHHDATHDTIVVSKSLDSRRVPRYIVEYIVYHEMLHIHHPTVHHKGVVTITHRRFVATRKSFRAIRRLKNGSSEA